MNTQRIIKICQEIDILQGEMKSIVACCPSAERDGADVKTEIDIILPKKKSTRKKTINDLRKSFDCCGGKNGMHKRDCSVSPSKPTPFGGHKCCGSNGPRHKKTCGKAQEVRQDEPPVQVVKVHCIECDWYGETRDLSGTKCPKCRASIIQ